jgi:hypothetical protein
LIIKLTSILLIVAIGAFHNGHLLMLQIYGWGSMFNNHYSSTKSIEMAVDMTFGGDNACDICENVIGALNQKDESKADDYMVLEYKPVILGLAARFNYVFQRVYHNFIEFHNPSIAVRVELTPTPPPRVF